MKIVIVTDEFYPRPGPCTVRIGSMAKFLKNKGHEVIVLTNKTNLEFSKKDKEIEKDYETKYLYGLPMIKKTFIGRLINNSSFAFSLAISKKIDNVDYTIITSPPLIISLGALIFSKRIKSKIIFDIRDIWPQVAAEIGAIKSTGLIYLIFDFIAKIMYRNANYIITVSKSKVDTLRNCLPNNLHKKIKLVANGIDEDFLDSYIDESIRKKYCIDDNSVVYIGNVGLAQGLDRLLDIAKISNDIDFLIFGEGASLAHLNSRISLEKISNVRLIGRVDHQEVASILHYAGTSFVSLDNENLKDSVPTKIFESIALNCPVFLLAEGEAKYIVEDSRIGIVSDYNDNVKVWSDNLKKCMDLKKNDNTKNIKKFIIKYSRQNQYSNLVKILEEGKYEN